MRPLDLILLRDTALDRQVSITRHASMVSVPRLLVVRVLLLDQTTLRPFALEAQVSTTRRASMASARRSLVQLVPLLGLTPLLLIASHKRANTTRLVLMVSAHRLLDHLVHLLDLTPSKDSASPKQASTTKSASMETVFHLTLEIPAQASLRTALSHTVISKLADGEMSATMDNVCLRAPAARRHHHAQPASHGFRRAQSARSFLSSLLLLQDASALQ